MPGSDPDPISDHPEWMRPDPNAPLPRVDLRTDRPHSARVYNHIIGGKDNFAADRETAAEVLADWPGLRTSMLANRSCMHRMARSLAGLGARQFIDVGTGIPSSPNLHEVVQATAPDSRVVYVDNDPIVLAHARALLVSSPAGRTAYIDSDMREPHRLLADPALQETLDLSEPVALTLIAMLQFVEDAQGLVDALLEPLAPGSFLALTIPTGDLAPESKRLSEGYTRRGIPMYLRTRAEVEQLFSGLELLDPGVVPMPNWRPAPDEVPLPDTATNMYAGVGRKR
jgi:trans-aconitate methyltransferase